MAAARSESGTPRSIVAFGAGLAVVLLAGVLFVAAVFGPMGSVAAAVRTGTAAPAVEGAVRPAESLLAHVPAAPARLSTVRALATRTGGLGPLRLAAWLVALLAGVVIAARAWSARLRRRTPAAVAVLLPRRRGPPLLV